MPKKVEIPGTGIVEFPDSMDNDAIAKAIQAMPGQKPAAPAGPNVTPGANDDDIIKSFGFDPAVIKSSSRYQQMVKDQGSGVSFMTTNTSEHPLLQAWRNAPVVAQLEDTGMGVHDTLSAIVQLARHGAGKLGLLPDADVQYGDLLDRVRNQDYLTNIRQGKASTALRFLGSVLTPLPGGPTVKAGDTLLKTALKGAAQGAKVGVLATPVDSGPPEDYWQQKGKQALVGAGVGAGFNTAIGAGSRAIDAWRGRNVPPEAQKVLDAGKQFKVRTSYGDVSGNVPAQKTEVALENIPGVGMSGFRAGQQQDAKSAAQGLKSQYFDQFLKTDPEAWEDVQRAAASGDQRARNLVEKLQNAGDDPDKVLQGSIGLSDFRTRAVAKDLYDTVEQLVKKNSLGDVPLNGAQGALKGAIDELRASKIPNKEVQGLLETVRKSISPKEVLPAEPPPEALANIQSYSAWKNQQGANLAQPFEQWRDANFAKGKGGAWVDNKTGQRYTEEQIKVLQQKLNPGQPAPPANSGGVDNGYGAIRNLLSDLGDRIRTYYQGNNAIIGEKGVGYLERVRNAIEADMSAFTRNSGVPEIQQAGEVADKYYKTSRVPFKDGMLAQAAVDTEPDQIFQRFIKAGKGDRAQKFYDALDARGKSAVRYEMVADSVNKATDPAKGIFSPQKFFTSMDKLNDAYGVFFSGRDKWEMDGFKNLMAHVTRAGQFAENPPTGNRLAHLITSGGAAAALGSGSPGAVSAVAAVGGTSLLAKSMFTTNFGKALLLNASKAQPGSAAMENLLDQAMPKLVNAAREETRRAAGPRASSSTPPKAE